MDFPSPPPVVEALRRRVEHGIYGYSLVTEAFTDALRADVERRHGWRIEPEWLVWLPSVVPGSGPLLPGVRRRRTTRS